MRGPYRALILGAGRGTAVWTPRRRHAGPDPDQPRGQPARHEDNRSASRRPDPAADISALLSTSQLPQTVFTGIAYRAPHTRIGALPARIANRIGRFRWIPGAASTYHVAGSYTRTGSDPCSGLDLSAPMFAPCLLVRPGTGRQDTVLTSLRLAGLRHSCARHSIPVTQVFKKCL